MLNACFLSRGLDIWDMPGNDCLCDQLSVKTSGSKSLMSFHDRQHLLSQLVVGRIMWIHWERTHGNLHLCLPQTSSHIPFPLANCALHPFSVINHSCPCGQILNPVGLPSEPSNLGADLGDPPTQDIIKAHLILFS